MFASLGDSRRRMIAIAGGSAVILIVAITAAMRFVRTEPRMIVDPMPPVVGVPTPPVNPPGGGGAPQTFPLYRGEPIRSLDADPVFLKQVSTDVYQKSLAELTGLAAALAENPGQPNLWMQVAYIKHYYNDDRGAADAYEYLNQIASGDPIPYYNLALLYGYNLKEPAKAAEKFRLAVARNPKRPTSYIGYAAFEREVRGDLAAAERILRDGIRAVANEPNLEVSLAYVLKQGGKIAEAITYYERALQHTPPGGERDAIAAELTRLRAQAQ